jgi:serine/threonine protein kinase
MLVRALFLTLLCTVISAPPALSDQRQPLLPQTNKTLKNPPKNQGYVKLGDFGFAKVLDGQGRTYTFCGTPGYVAPENVLAHGYNTSVDWWGLGVLLYVLLTGRQPFSSPKTDDPMVVMRRIVDEAWAIKYPPYLSAAAKVGGGGCCCDVLSGGAGFVCWSVNVVALWFGANQQIAAPTTPTKPKLNPTNDARF